MIRFLSDRIPVTLPTDVDPDRYEFINPSSVEPNLGVAAGTNYILVTNQQGIREWKRPVDIPGLSVTDWTLITENYTASEGDNLLTDTSAGSFSIALPANPIVGDYVIFADTGMWGENNLLITANGSTIENMLVDFNLDVSHIKITFIYDGNTWHVYV